MANTLSFENKAVNSNVTKATLIEPVKEFKLNSSGIAVPNGFNNLSGKKTVKTVVATNTVAVATYCSSSGTTTYQTSITSVAFNTINQTSAKPSGYSDYSSLSTDVIAGNTYSLSVNVNTDGNYNIYTNAWIDWNGDGVFDNTERYDLGVTTNQSNGATASSALSITVPSGATLGTTRMRVSSKYNVYSSSCETGFDGEVEDYSIIVNPTGPTLNVSASTLNFGYVASGATSANQSFVLSGSYLTGYPGNITVTAPSNYEISLSSGSGFGASLSIPYTTTTLTNTTIYIRFKPTSIYSYAGDISISGGGASATAIAVSGTALSYCTASGATCDEYISNVQVGTINNTSSCSGGYTDYTTIKTSMIVGASYPLTITNGKVYSGDQCGVWIDWNNDGDFLDANETITVSGGASTFTATIVPPVAATSGFVRMRIRIRYSGGTVDSCDATTWGEVEDYLINVVPKITTGTISGSPFCTSSSVSVPFTISGTFTSGNVFSAQLSDATGGFGTPTVIGTLTSTTAGTISTTIPALTAAGTGYRIRVVSSLPSVVGSTNATNLVVNLVPTITSSITSSSCGSGNVVLKAAASAGTINWYAGATGGVSLATGTSFTTPILTSTTSYWVDATNNSCTTSIRTQVIATISAGLVEVNATAGTVFGCYTTLKAAFDNINNGTHQGAVTIKVKGSTTETATAALLNSGNVSGALYTTVLLYPTAPSLKIEGSVVGPLINLNGADNVTIDGRINQSGGTSLTFSNTNTGGNVIQYITDATSNTLQYCTLQGVTTSASSGVVVFGLGDVVGNDNNTIDNCDIRDGVTTPTNAIYSAGSSITADNSAITISNCNIYNYFNSTVSSNGINIASNSSVWTISANKFYQSATRTTTTTSLTHRAINILTASGINYSINNNVIGYGNSSGAGTSIYNGQATLYRGIEITVSTGATSNIQGNSIANIDFTTTSGLTTVPGIFTGISILGGNVNIGTTSGNTIGGATGNGSINITSTTTVGAVYGISASTTGSIAISNNTVGSITTIGTTAIGYNFNGIYTAGTGGNFTIASNLIGSTATANSISIGDGTTTSGVCTLRSIYNVATGIISITGNTIQNNSVYGTGLSILTGIINSAGSGTLDINSNNIISCSNTGTGIFVGITNSSAVATLNINNNVIRNCLKTAALGTFTAISNSGAVNSYINVNNNQLGNATGGLITYSAANSSTLAGISNTAGAATCELSIQNNDIRGITHSVAASTAHTYISNSANSLKQIISTNTFTNLNVNTTGAIIFISNSVSMPTNGVQNVDNNSIVTAYVRTATSISGAITLFTSGAATNNTGVVVTNNNNNFSNITVSGGATILGWLNSDAGTASVDKTIYNNKFENWTGGTGAITALTVNVVSEACKVFSNSIQNISNSQSITAITSTGNEKIYLNTINNLSSSAGGASSVITGINVIAGTTKSIYQNTISNLIGNTLTTGSVRGIYITTGTTINVYENKISGLSANSNTTGTITGIWVFGGVTINLDRNKIYDISSSSASISSGLVYGIQVSNSTVSLTTNITNNVIGDLRVTASSGTELIRGIGLLSTGLTSNHNVYYNTVILSAPTTSGAIIGSSALYHASSATSTTAALDLRNNIFINTSEVKGTGGYAVAFRRSLGTTANSLSNYATTSKSNLFYAGVPSTSRLIYTDGTNSAQTIALYKILNNTTGTIAPRDQVSVSENLTFISTTGSSADYLKVNTSIATQIESGAVNIVGYTVDYAGVVRQGNTGYLGTSTTGPDIGAYENNYVSIDQSAPAINYTALTDNSCLSNKTILATISDASGVNVIAGTRPRIYYKKTSNSDVLPTTNTNTTNGWKFFETTDTASPFTLAINYSLLFGGATTGDVIQYFITAQDNATPSPYVGVNTGTFAIAPVSVALTSTAFPVTGTINSFTILAGVSGTVTVGSGGTYPSLTGVGGLFADLNTKGLSANLTANIISDITELGTNALNQLNYGCAALSTLTISPSGGVARTISGTIAGGALLNFNGADNIVVDGLNTGGNSLIISNASTSATAGTSTIRFINDAGNNVVKNCTIEGAGTSVSNGTLFFSTGASLGNINNVITNNTIKAVGTNLPTNAIYSAGTSVLVDNSEITISNNTIQDYFNATAASNGIFVALNSSAWIITGNKFIQTANRTTTTTALTHRAINIFTALGINYDVNNNVIGYDSSAGTGNSVYTGQATLFRGIEMTVGTSIASNVQGNTISNINFSTTSASTATSGIFSGISILGGNVNIGTISGNTIGATTGNGSVNITSTVTVGLITGIYASSTGIVNIINNKIGSISSGGTAGIGYLFYGIYTLGGGQFTISDNIIGSTSTTNSIAVGTLGTTTSGVCSLNGINNASTGGVIISGNIIQNVSSYGTAASIITGILNSGIAATVSITNNSIIAPTTVGTGTLTGISNTAAATTVAITTNKIRNISRSVAAGAVTVISNTGIVLTSLTIDNNQLGNTDGDLINYTVANSGTLTGISNGNGSANCAVSIQNNDIKGIVYGVAGTNIHNYISNTAATLTQNINGNTFTALTVNTTAAITFISNNVAMPTNGVQNVNNNSIVTSFTRVAAVGAISLFSSFTATNNSNVTVNNNGNNFSNITINGGGTISGWVNTDAGTGLVNKTISGNTFENWTGGTGAITVMNVNITSTTNATALNTIRNITSAGIIYGITTAVGNDNIYSNTISQLVSTGGTITVVYGVLITNGTSKNIYKNTIFNLQANNITTGIVSGIAVQAGLNNTIYNNKIYDISSSSASLSGSVNGILVSGTTADQITTIHNNRIGNIAASVASTLDNVRGISMANSGLRSTTNVYFNTIYLNATSAGTNFGSTGIYHTANIVASTGVLNLRNNIIVNTSTAKGTGLTVAFRQSSAVANALSNYSALSNNNLFYAGISGAKNLIFYNGTNSAQNISSYTTGVFTAGTISPRDQLSISEIPDFKSTAGISADFLKLNNVNITFIESGAVNIAGIMTDYDNDIRAGNAGYLVQTNGSGVAPDIGADEFDGKLPNVIVSSANAGSNGSYSKVADAFTAINGYDQTGNNVIVSLIGSTTESSSAVLNQGTWTSLKMYPTNTGVTITGNLAGLPLINFNGADNVTIDGRVNQTGSAKSLTIVNSSTSNTAGTTTIRLTNAAETNTVKYININGSSNNIADGVIEFVTSNTGNGNRSNIIEYNSISNSGGNRPLNAIYSAGTSGKENSLNTIRYNSIFDFINASNSSNGVYVGANSSEWTITNNSFYETSSFVPSAGSFNYTAISIDNASGNNFTISNNYIGGKAASNGGGSWTVTANTNHSFRGIYLNVGSTTASSLQANAINNFSYTTSSATPWRAIEVNAGALNIGTSTGNIIGSTTSINAISITANVNADSYGLYIASAAAITISKSSIGSISVYGNSTNASHSFTGIYKKSGVAGALTITSNVIGSATVSNSIAALSTASAASTGQKLRGIYLQSTGVNSISNNTISNLYNAYSGTQDSRTVGVYTTDGSSTLVKNNIYNLSSNALGTAIGTVSGVEMTGTTMINTITETIIYNLSSTNSSFKGYLTGIYFNGGTASNLVNRNFIRSLSVHSSSTNASIYGIRIEQGGTTFANNIITLGGDTATTIYGIYSSGTSGNSPKLYFNTIYLNGTLGSGIATKSYAFYEATGGEIRDFRNNIFSNFRSTTGGSNVHYALYLNYSGANNLTLDYNIYWASGTGAKIGYYSGSTISTLPIVSTKDGNSTVSNPNFANGGGITATDYKVSDSSEGASGTGIILDYGQSARGVPPNIGAWEFNTNSWNGTISTDFANPVNWSAGSVPLEDASVVFSTSPLRDCVLDQDRIIGSVINSQEIYKFNLNGKKLTIHGDFYLSNGAVIDASAVGTTVVLEGDDLQTISNGAFVNDIVTNLTINNANGVISNSDLTINGNLNLVSANPSDVKGSIDSGTYTITMGANAVTLGDGDVTGIVKRSTIVANKTYTFGNKNETIYFENTGTLPTSVSVKLTIGTAPSWKSTGVKRIYEVIQTGASLSSPTSATIKSAYLNSELNGNDENKIVFFSYRNSSGDLYEHGRSNSNTTENWVKLANVNMAFFPSTFGGVELGLSNNGISTLTWNGSVSTSWTTVNNWTPIGAPSDFVDIIIPNSTGTTYSPIIPIETTIKTINLKSGSIVNSVANAQMTLLDGANVWANEGGVLNANTSTVKFKSSTADISGTTSFYNVTIDTGANLTMKTGSIMRIGGTMTNSGVWQTAYNGNITTVDYNGPNQIVVVPNSVTNRYSSLILSGSGIKTLPTVDLSVLGDLTLGGAVTVTTPNNMDILGNFTIGSTATFNSGAKTHNIGGNFIQNGTFNTANSTFLLNGLGTAQNISGTASSVEFNNLVVYNSFGVTSAKNLTVNGYLDLQSDNPTDLLGSLDMGSNTLFLTAAAVTTGTGDVTGIVKRAHTFVTNQAYTFGNANAKVFFSADGTKPTDFSIKTTIGNAPSWKTSAINRVYDIIRTGGAGNFIDVQVNYLESELNGINEDEIVFFNATGLPSATVSEWGISISDTNNNVATIKTLGVGLFATAFGQNQVSLSNSSYPNLTWNGSLSTDWNTNTNWTPISYPSKLSKLTIPNASGTPQSPLLPAVAEARQLIIQNGGVLNASAGSQFSLKNNSGDVVWQNSGGAFNASTSTVIFSDISQKISGSTNFYNMTVASGASLTPQVSSTMGILGSFTNNGVLDATAFSNTINYNGAAQTVINPNGTIPGYSILNLSGSGIKTMPNTAMNILGDFSVSGTASATTNSVLNVGGNLSIATGSGFNSGANVLKVAANFTTNGTYSASAAGTLELNGTASQSISGSATPLSLGNLIISNTGGTVSTSIDLRCIGNFTNSGTLNMNSNLLSVSNSISNTGTLLTAVPASQSVTPIPSGINWGGTVVYNVDAAQNAVTGNYTNLTINNGVGVTVTAAATVNISGALLINSGKKIIIDADNILTVTGSITNNGGTAGLVLKSTAAGTASLVHNSNNVPATVQRYISGAKEAWHFISAPVSTQAIKGTSWTPSGTYGNGTGYDLYLWNEPTPCWTYLLNTTVAPTWASLHATTDFIPGRGYLYSTQALNPTKEFAGLLNNGTVTYPLTNSSPDLTVKGFNLIGNPYPSSIDWKAVSGWTRSDLKTSAGGYDMYIWSSAANNYGVYNSLGTTGTNNVTQYIPPTQGFFVRASTAGSISMGNAVRVNIGANNWLKIKSSKSTSLKVRIESNEGLGYDEVLLQFGYSSNQPGALKLFSRNESAPSAYLNDLKEDLSVRYLTDTEENSIVPLQFKAGKEGNYSLSIDNKSASFDVLLLEDKKTKTITDLNVNSTYQFKGSVKDVTDRFILHFTTIEKEAEIVPTSIYYDGTEINVDLSLINEQRTIKIYDVLGKLLVDKKVSGKMIHRFTISPKNEVYIVVVSGEGTNVSRKVLVY